MIKDENKVYPANAVSQLIDRDALALHRSKHSGGLNTFCVAKNCAVVHRGKNLSK